MPSLCYLAGYVSDYENNGERRSVKCDLGPSPLGAEDAHGEMNRLPILDPSLASLTASNVRVGRIDLVSRAFGPLQTATTTSFSSSYALARCGDVIERNVRLTHSQADFSLSLSRCICAACIRRSSARREVRDDGAGRDARSVRRRGAVNAFFVYLICQSPPRLKAKRDQNCPIVEGTNTRPRRL